MKTKLLTVCLITLLPLCACSNKKDASEENFRQAINLYLETDGHGALCLHPGNFPQDITQAHVKKQRRDARRMAALQAVGLVTSEKTSLTEKMLFSKHTRTVPVVRYSLSDAAKPFLQVKKSFNHLTGHQTRTSLCWGKMTVDKVAKWDPLVKIDKISTTTAHYTYTLTDVADWAKNPAIQAAWPSVKTYFDNQKDETRKMDLILTDNGWMPASMVKIPM